MGRRTSMVDPLDSTTWVYNALGQVTSETRTIEGVNYTTTGTYDPFGRLLTQNLLGSETLTYAYNAMGALSSLSGLSNYNYVSQIHYDASGQATDQLLGSGLLQQSCYDANTERLLSTRTYPGSLQSCVNQTPANARLNLAYTYQNNGNISQMVDYTRSETLTYGYDELDRLLSVGGPYSKSYTYYPIGNIQTNSGTTYTYGDTNHKHAVTSLSTGETYAYDANGNMITRVENGQTYTQTFDIENRLASVTVGGQTTQFFYDGDGNLTKKLKPDGSKTFYTGMYEVDKTSGGTVTKIAVYYPVGGAMRINGTLYFILTDHLGSSSVMTDASGTTVGEDRFYPYGETRFTTGSMYTDQLFTGQREMTGLGIYHYGARFYSPKLGRFLSADSIVPGAANPQAFNRYSYVLGNPLKYTDPSGHGQCQTKEDCEDMGTTPMGDSNSIPEVIDPENLTDAGAAGYEVYLKLFYFRNGWWWTDKNLGGDGQFSVADFVAMILFEEGGSIAGAPYFDLWMETAVRSYYNWAKGKDSRLTSGSAGLLNYLFAQSGRNTRTEPSDFDGNVNPSVGIPKVKDVVKAMLNPTTVGHPEWTAGCASETPCQMGSYNRNGSNNLPYIQTFIKRGCEPSFAVFPSCSAPDFVFFLTTDEANLWASVLDK